MDVHELLAAAISAPMDEQAEGSMAAVSGVLAVCEVRADPDTRTLSMALRDGHAILRVNEDFVSSYVEDQADALFVVAHETQHVICEHASFPRIPGVPAPVVNLALDLQVNGAILRNLLEPTPGILGRLYRHDRFPDLLLRPPTDIIDIMAEGDSDARTLADSTLRQLAASVRTDPLHRARVEVLLREHFSKLAGVQNPEAMVRAYLDGWCEAQEPWSWLLRFLRLMGRAVHQEGWGRVLVLGDHDRRERAKTNSWSRAWGWSRKKENLSLDVEPPPAVVMARFREAAQRALAPWLAGDCLVDTTLESSVIPATGRREQVLLAAGITPVMYTHRSTSLLPPEQRVHLYLDVSGSMVRERNWYGSLARVLGEQLAEPVWVWSTEVRQASLADVVRGEMPSDGGTSIEPVVEHAIEKGFRRVLVLTDGVFGFEPELLARKVKEAGLEMVFLVLRERASRMDCGGLEGIARVVMEVGG